MLESSINSTGFIGIIYLDDIYDGGECRASVSASTPGQRRLSNGKRFPTSTSHLRFSNSVLWELMQHDGQGDDDNVSRKQLVVKLIEPENRTTLSGLDTGNTNLARSTG
jgi:hypothetical protein